MSVEGAPSAPLDVMAKLSTVLGCNHAPHLLSGVLACLAPHLQAYPSEGGRQACDVVAVVGLARVLIGDGRPTYSPASCWPSRRGCPPLRPGRAYRPRRHRQRP